MSDSSTANVVFVGLGAMGIPMALNLARSGFTVTGVARSRKSSHDGLAAAGINVVTDLDQALRDSDIIITMLPAGREVSEVMDATRLRRIGLAGPLWIDHSTIDPRTAITLSSELSEIGVRCLDAPVSGGTGGAAVASLSIMVGGNVDDFAAAGPVFSAVGSKATHMGEAGAGQLTKAINQLLVAGNISLVAEAIKLAEAGGLKPEHVQEALTGGAANSWALRNAGDRMVRNNFAPGFRIDLQLKDLRIGLSAAERVGVHAPMLAGVATIYENAADKGLGHLDHSAVYQLLD